VRTNGFALYRGEDAGEVAARAAERVKRYSKKVLLGGDGEFTESGGARPSRRKEVWLAYWLEGKGLPVVHGFHPEGVTGEYSLAGGWDGEPLERDPLGTRGLWTHGRSVASDYRLLAPGARLVAPKRRPRAKKVGMGFDRAAERLASLVQESVSMRVKGERRVAVSFSGGLDSSMVALAASKVTEVVLCSAFAAGSRDETQAERAAGLLGLRLETATLDAASVARSAKGAELPPGERTTMDVALWSIYSATSSLARRAGATTILLGQLADELFGGYMKYALKGREDAGAAERMMEGDVRACADYGLLRDEAACSSSCEVRFPFADVKIADFAMGLPFEFKVRDGERKAVLREAARQMGLPDELAQAPKKAAQFSSGVAKLVKAA